MPDSSHAPETPTCWRCKKAPGVVYDGTTHECVGCAGQTAKRSREMLNQIDAAVREGLTAYPRIMDRVEFVRECVKLHRSDAARRAAADEPADRRMRANHCSGCGAAYSLGAVTHLGGCPMLGGRQ